MNATKSSILEYIKREYGDEPEFLWAKTPTYAVLRHDSNKKWYAAIIDVPRQKLGLVGADPVDILLIKCDPLLIGSLLQSPGYLPAYHMNKTNWVSILLDGSVPMEDAVNLLNLSYDLTKKKRK